MTVTGKTLEPTIVRLHEFADTSPEGHLYYGVHVLDALHDIPDNSVHVVCTSPPYWNLRDYGDPGQIGLEPTPEEYVQQLVEVFREIRRVLRPDGTLWLNIGDSYAPDGKRGFKPRDLMGLPWRVAFALQKEGWYLRAAAPWIKRTCMPENVQSRPTVAHEMVFLLSGSDRYFYDKEAVQKTGRNRRSSDWFLESIQDILDGGQAMLVDDDGMPLSFHANPKGFKGAHFACFPPKLVEPCLLAGTSQHGVCPQCGSPWKRLIEFGEVLSTGGSSTGARASNMGQVSVLDQNPEKGAYNTGNMVQREHITTGWEPTCECGGEERGRPLVLDPFSGSATTGQVAMSLGCDYVGLDLQAEYLPVAVARLRGEAVPPKKVGTEEEDLFAMLEDKD